MGTSQRAKNYTLVTCAFTPLCINIPLTFHIL